MENVGSLFLKKIQLKLIKSRRVDVSVKMEPQQNWWRTGGGGGPAG